MGAATEIITPPLAPVVRDAVDRRQEELQQQRKSTGRMLGQLVPASLMADWKQVFRVYDPN
jgi:hypothetical protein